MIWKVELDLRNWVSVLLDCINQHTWNATVKQIWRFKPFTPASHSLFYLQLRRKIVINKTFIHLQIQSVLWHNLLEPAVPNNFKRNVQHRKERLGWWGRLWVWAKCWCQDISKARISRWAWGRCVCWKSLNMTKAPPNTISQSPAESEQKSRRQNPHYSANPWDLLWDFFKSVLWWWLRISFQPNKYV